MLYVCLRMCKDLCSFAIGSFVARIMDRLGRVLFASVHFSNFVWTLIVAWVLWHFCITRFVLEFFQIANFAPRRRLSKNSVKRLEEIRRSNLLHRAASRKQYYHMERKCLLEKGVARVNRLSFRYCLIASAWCEFSLDLLALRLVGWQLTLKLNGFRCCRPFSHAY